MKSTHRRALKYAYHALRGDFADAPGPALRGEGLHDPAHPISRFENHWIQPDADPERSYLNEAVCVDLEMRGYFECRMFLPGPVWLYRLTAEGCRAVGLRYPALSHLPADSGPPSFRQGGQGDGQGIGRQPTQHARRTRHSKAYSRW